MKVESEHADAPLPKATERTAGDRPRMPIIGLLLRALRQAGVVIAFVAMIATFSASRPDIFPTFDNARAILDQAAVLGIVAAGLTVVLVIGEFDLSFAATVGLSGAAGVLVMRDLGQGALVAALVAVGVGALIGVVNGLIVAYGRVPAFIGTLAVASAVTGVERAFTNDRAIYEGVSQSYTALTRTRVGGLTLSIIISILVVGLVWLLLSMTVFGRRAYAVGGGKQAARLAGVRVERVVLFSFVVLGICAALAGIVVTSRAGSTFPNSGAGLLLPAYAAAFLGASAMRTRRFHPVGTYFGVIFMGSLATGLIILSYPSWTTDLIQGAVLGAAVLVARRT